MIAVAPSESAAGGDLTSTREFQLALLRAATHCSESATTRPHEPPRPQASKVQHTLEVREQHIGHSSTPTSIVSPIDSTFDNCLQPQSFSTKQTLGCQWQQARAWQAIELSGLLGPITGLIMRARQFESVRFAAISGPHQVGNAGRILSSIVWQWHMGVPWSSCSSQA